MDMCKSNRVQGHRSPWDRSALPRIMALLAVFLAAVIVLSTQAVLARPVLSDGTTYTGSTPGAMVYKPIPGQAVYTVAFSQQSTAVMETARKQVINIVQANNGGLLCEFPAIDAIGVCVPDGVAGQLRVVPGVRYVEADVEYQFSMDEAAEQVDVMPLWDEAIPDSQYDGHGIVVCVIDSGAATWHPDLRGKINKIYNFVGETEEIDTSGANYVNGIDNSISGHGTFVASQIVGSGAASTGADGGPGIYKGTLPGYAGKIARDDPEYTELRGPFKGLAPGVTLYPMRVSIGSGASSLAIKSAIQKAISFRTDTDPNTWCDVISMSMNSGVEDQSMNEMVAKAVNAGIVFVVSAGNAGDDPGTVQCPANLPQVITVGAVTRSDEVADFSSRGPTRSGVMKPDITAVGESVIAASRALGDVNGPSTPAYDPENNFQRYYQEYSGTSMSTPEVAAAAAIVLQRYNDLYPNRLDLTPEQVKQILIKSARHPYGCPAGGDSDWGNGVLDIYAAIKLVEQDLIPAAGDATVPSAYFEMPAYSVSESSGFIDINIVANDVPADGIKLKVEAFSGSGAVPGQDFAADTRVMTFTRDDPIQAFPVEIFDNPLPEGQKVFIVKMGPENPDDQIFIPVETCKVTIRDDDQAVVSFAVDSYTVREQQSAFNLPIKVMADWTGNPAAGDITVRVEAIDGSATAGTDFTPILPDIQTVTIVKVPGTMVVEQTVDVEIRPSAGTEGLEYFTVKLSDPENAVLGNPSSDTVWVRPSAIDATPPRVVSCVTPTPTVGEGWYTSSVQVDITVADDSTGSGIDYLEYNVNDGPTTTVEGGQAHPVISANGVNSLDYRAADNCGNAIEGRPVTIKIDLAPPETICTMQSDDTIPGLIKVTLAASDGAPGEGTGVDTIYYKKYGDTAFQPYTGEFTVEDGSGAVEFYSVDVAGHQEAVKSRTVQVDIAPPVTASTLGGTPVAGGWYNGDVTVTLSATDDHLGVPSIEYKLNDGDWAPYNEPFTVSAEGENKVIYRSTDLAGNVEAIRTTHVKIDRTPPMSFCTLNPGTAWTNAESVLVTLTAVDNVGSYEGGAGVKYIKYSLDGGNTWTSYTPSADPCTFSVTAAGETTVLFYAEDKTGNVETGTDPYYAPFIGQKIRIDRTPPEVTYTVTPASPSPDGWYYGTVTIEYIAIDSGGSGLQGLSSFTDILTVPGAEQYSEVPVRDNAGNVITEKVGPFNIASATLTLGTITAPVNPIAEGSPEATVSVSAPYTGGPITEATWAWGDMTTGTPGTITGDTITGTHQYAKPGIYTITLIVRDSTGATVSGKYEYVVVFDPSSLLTAAGRASSPVGAYYASPTKGGVDIFATHSQYIRGKMLACSFCNFNYNSGTMPWDDLLFISTSSDWMVVTGNKGYYQGTGLILEKRAGAKVQYVNGYKFLFSGLDVSGGKDMFRMKIWNPTTGEIKYDSQFDVPIDADATTTINAGNVFVKG